MANLTRFERTRIISARALQLSLGAPPMVKAPKETSMLDLASLELEKDVLPLAVIRRYPDGREEKLSI